MLSPELHSRTRRTLPELIAHPSQFAPRITSDPFAFPDPFAFLARAPGIRWPTGQIISPIESPWEAHHGYR